MDEKPDYHRLSSQYVHIAIAILPNQCQSDQAMGKSSAGAISISFVSCSFSMMDNTAKSTGMQLRQFSDDRVASYMMSPSILMRLICLCLLLGQLQAKWPIFPQLKQALLVD